MQPPIRVPHRADGEGGVGGVAGGAQHGARAGLQAEVARPQVGVNHLQTHTFWCCRRGLPGTVDCREWLGNTGSCWTYCQELSGIVRNCWELSGMVAGGVWLSSPARSRNRRRPALTTTTTTAPGMWMRNVVRPPDLSCRSSGSSTVHGRTGCCCRPQHPTGRLRAWPHLTLFCLDAIH